MSSPLHNYYNIGKTYIVGDVSSLLNTILQYFFFLHMESKMENSRIVNNIKHLIIKYITNDAYIAHLMYRKNKMLRFCESVFIIT